MNRFLITLICFVFSLSAFAKPAKQKKPLQARENKKFEEVKNQYRMGDIAQDKLWQRLNDFSQDRASLTADQRVNLLQMQSSILADEGYPITATLFSTDAITAAKNPFGPETTPSWTLITRLMQKYPLDVIMQNLADSLKQSVKSDTIPPVLNSAWFYFVGNNLAEKGKSREALAAFENIKITDRYFLVSKYQSAIIYLTLGEWNNAEVALKTILNPVAQAKATLEDEELTQVNNYAKLALARMYYEQKQFKNAVKFYRAIDRDSPQFYNALFEQAWAFFMAGYPNHALGALHSVESPFFKEEFNPEAAMLRAITYYWMCRYDDSRMALADFMDHHAETVKSLSGFLDRKKLTDETAYQLFEDLVTGVSESSLGIPRSILLSAAQEDGMLLFRSQYADAIRELDELEKEFVFGDRNASQASIQKLRQYSSILRRKIGSQYISELRSMKTEFDTLYEQGEFLYVELLMSEKEQLLGRELHASSKIDEIAPTRALGIWGSGDQSWQGANLKDEYWWDEVGYYIYQAEPKCNK